MAEPREKKFQFEWSRTWGDEKPFDYSAKDGDLKIGRVYKVNGGPADAQWYWAMNAHLPPPAGQSKGGLMGSDQGVADARDEACRKVEESYLKMRHRAAKMGLGHTAG